MSRRSLNGCRVLVTGASSGIGRHLAVELARRKSKLIVTARRAERLATLVDEVRGIGAEAKSFAGDIACDETRQNLLAFTKRQFGGLDALVNNAGVGAIGNFADADSARLRRIMEVNFFAPVELIRLFLPLLARGNLPVIVNVGSVLGHCAVPNKSEYCASKFALHGFSDALRCELSNEGIDVVLVSPSTTESEFFDNVIQGRQEATKGSSMAVSPKRVARAIVSGMRRGKSELILTFGGRALVWSDRLVPGVMRFILSRLG